MGLLDRLGRAAWATLTSVRFAVILIILIAVAGLIGTVVRQFPSAALHDPAMYAREVADMHVRWDGIQPLGVRIGPAMVDVFERLGLFRIFSAPWFLLLLVVLVIAIVCCTLERTPRLWQQTRPGRIDQPSAFFDPRLSDRAVLESAALDAAAVRRVLRGRHFRVIRRVDDAEAGVTWLQGDRNQYHKLATLISHLGLVLFLLGGAVTVAFGFETVVFVGEGQTAPVQPVGTKDNLLVRNNGFRMPLNPNGTPADFVTDLSVFQGGQEIARKDIRVNDPLEVQGYVFHQNTFGPSVDLTIHDPAGALVWTGPLLLDDEVADFPSGFMTVPGSDVGLLTVLTRNPDGVALLVLQGIGMGDTIDDGLPGTEVVGVDLFRTVVTLGGMADPVQTGGYGIRWDGASSWTGMVIKNDPGAPVIWFAFVCLMIGLGLTFYFPRRRAWVRIEGDTLRVAVLADRYVDVRRELQGLTDALRRAAASASPVTAADTTTPGTP
ncbi:MAG: cytochrome c biogenesis protein ResB [Chloroflexi bacterium]|nr:cytochrome c biogenesis protein ResB [Chloroflexota bacterium]